MCGDKVTEEDMLEKTFTTFHASNVLLRQQYRERRFTKYSELISSLLVAEQNNELLLKNHQSRPIGSMSLPKANATCVQTLGHGQDLDMDEVKDVVTFEVVVNTILLIVVVLKVKKKQLKPPKVE